MNGPLPLIDLIASRAERDKAIAQVTEHNPDFVDAVLSVVKELPRDWIGRGEDVRFKCEEMGIKPKHSNAWGAAISVAAKRGLLRRTGKWVCMRKVSSHGRLTPQYARA